MKVLKYFLVVILCQNVIQVQGQELAHEIPEPYMLTSQIPEISIDPVDCIQLIRHMPHSDQQTEEVSSLISQIENQMLETKESFDRLNQEIFDLESGPENSLTSLDFILEETYPLVYQDYYDSDEDFSFLTEEEQVQVIESDSRIESLRADILAIEEIIHDKVNERDQIESYYQQLSYDLDNLIHQDAQMQDDQQEYNQCLLYPYAVAFLSEDALMINPETENFSEFLLSIDHILQKLIPKAYQKVTYEEIFQTYQAMLTGEESYSLQTGKLPIVFDDSNSFMYEFQKEFNLKDIRFLASHAKKNYDKNQDMTEFITSYQKIIKIKNQQYINFSAINQEALGKIKEYLVNYLNRHDLKDQETIYKIRNLNLRYQVKLALYDDIQEIWIVSGEETSGYLHEYLDKDFMIIEDKELESTSIEDSEPPLQTQLISDQSHQMINNRNRAENKFGKIKDRLPSGKPGSQTKELNRLDGERKKKVTSNPADKDNTKLKLPSTGELASLTRIILGILAIVLAFFLLNIHIKHKDKIKRKDIELD